MVGGEVDEDLGPEEPRPVDEWPPPSSNLELANKEVASSRLLFLTVQYVGEEGGSNFNTELEDFSELQQRVVSPLDPNMGCTACLSPVYRPSTPLIPPPVSPTGGYLNPSSPPTPATSLSEPSMIVLSDQCLPDNYVVTSTGPLYSESQESADDSKLLLLSTDSAQPTELVVTGGETCGDQRVELLLNNGTIAYGIVESSDNTGIRVIQIPKEYLVTASTDGQSTNLPQEDPTVQADNVQVNSVQNENVQEEGVSGESEQDGQLRALYNTLKEQGLIIEQGELRLEPDLDQNTQLMDTALLDQSAIVSQHCPTPELQQRFFCEECNVLLESNCQVHQINCKITDKAVPSRARATLPASYLAINRIQDSIREEYGVFARKSIPKRTQFGPIEGVIIKTEDVMVMPEKPYLDLTIENENGEMRTLDVSNEHMSNWMRFVRMATDTRPPNLLLSQMGTSLYFTTTNVIRHREELVVWYSQAYAVRRNLPTDPQSLDFHDSADKIKQSFVELTSQVRTHKTVEKREENLTINSLRSKNQALIAQVKKDNSEKKYFHAKPKKQFECVMCNKKFPTSYILRRHINLLHARENRYNCKYCNQGFSHSYNRLSHMRRFHSEHCKDIKPLDQQIVNRYETWTCTHCKLMFSSPSMLNLHTLVHAANNIEENMMNLPDNFHEVLQRRQELVSCPQCTKKFTNKRKLASHVAEHSKKRDVNEKYHCEVCGRSFVSEVRFKAHSDTHGDDDKKPLQCNICLKRVLTNSALSCHIKIHCGVQWECPMCKQHFSNVLALRSHVHAHAVDGVYRCPHCNKSFEEYSVIRKHIRAFHSARKYGCQNCGKRFPTQDKLRMHMLKHSDNKDFLCHDCGSLFKRKDKLTEHMKRMHSGQNRSSAAAAVQQPTPEKKPLTRMIANSADYERYIYKCHTCVLGFKRRGMLVNHLANKHPNITPDSVPELNLPILKTTRDYFCQYCDKIYKSSSKRKAHILKNHPGLELPISNRQKGGVPEIPGLPNPTYSQTVGTVTTTPHACQWCHKQYASKAKLLQHLRKKHVNLLLDDPQVSPPSKISAAEDKQDKIGQNETNAQIVNVCDITDENPVPVALTTNINHQYALISSHLQEYEIIAGDEETAVGTILMDTSSIKRTSNKQNDNISSDLLSQAMSEIGVSLSELRALSLEQYLKMLQSPNGLIALDPYTPYTAR